MEYFKLTIHNGYQILFNNQRLQNTNTYDAIVETEEIPFCFYYSVITLALLVLSCIHGTLYSRSGAK